MTRASALTVLLVLLLASTAAAQPLPMPPAPDAQPDPSWWGILLAYLYQLQGDLWRGLQKAVRAVKEEGSLSATSWLLGLSFFYGVVHAAGPGHGKAIITAYLVGNESAVRRGIILSFLSAAAQGITAISAVGILAALLGFLGREVAEVAKVLEVASYAMIAGIGLYLVVQTLRSIIAGRDLHDHAHDHAHDHNHEHEHTHITPQEAGSWGRGAAVVAAVGLRPCMGAVIVLVVALAQGIFFLGMLATAAMSLGTAITVAVLAVLASGSRGLALRLAGTMDGWLLWTYWGLSLVGGLALFVIGSAFLIAPPPPSPFPGAG